MCIYIFYSYILDMLYIFYIYLVLLLLLESKTHYIDLSYYFMFMEKISKIMLSGRH